MDTLIKGKARMTAELKGNLTSTSKAELAGLPIFK